LGVIAIEFIGEKNAFNVPVLGKGCVGIVVAAHTKSSRVALKIRRVDADRKGMEHEARMLVRANSVGVGPSFIGIGKDFLLMEFIDGMLLPEWISNLKGRGIKRRIRQVLKAIIEQCRRLDEVGLDHGELSRAPKHIIIDREDNAYIVDFETASINRRTSNVTSICQFLFLGSQLAKTLRGRIGEIDKDVLIDALRNYKLARSNQNLDRILRVSSLM